MAAGQKRWLLVVALAAAVGGLLCVGWRMWHVARASQAMAQIERAMETGRNGWAAQALRGFLQSHPSSDLAMYLLGLCEKARGQTEEAFKVWGRVSPDSPHAGQAVLGRMKLRSDRGRFAEAEAVVTAALDDRRLDRLGLGALLVDDYAYEGRVEEAARLIEDSWRRLNEAGERASEKAIDLARRHMELDWDVTPIESLRGYFEQAAQLAPEDDRVMLGRANLAIRAGAHGEASRWLDACLRRRPEDASVWRSRLKWAIASNRPADARAALGHLPASELAPGEVDRVAAWLAAGRGDSASETLALERLIARDPADTRALERLAALAISDGRPDRATELRGRKDEVERLKTRYRKLHERNQPARDAAEMALLAEQLGRWFEARVFLTFALEEEPERGELHSLADRLRRRADKSAAPAANLADLLRD